MTPTYRLDPPPRPRMAVAVAIGLPVVVIVVHYSSIFRRYDMKRKCETCGEEVEIQTSHEHPSNWVATGRSKYGKEYDSRGIGWWCPACKVKEAWYNG